MKLLYIFILTGPNRCSKLTNCLISRENYTKVFSYVSNLCRSRYIQNNNIGKCRIFVESWNILFSITTFIQYKQLIPFQNVYTWSKFYRSALPILATNCSLNDLCGQIKLHSREHLFKIHTKIYTSWKIVGRGLQPFSWKFHAAFQPSSWSETISVIK